TCHCDPARFLIRAEQVSDFNDALFVPIGDAGLNAAFAWRMRVGAGSPLVRDDVSTPPEQKKQRKVTACVTASGRGEADSRCGRASVRAAQNRELYLHLPRPRSASRE